MNKYCILLILLFLSCGKIVPPDYGQMLYDNLRGTPGQKESARKHLRLYCKQYAVSEGVMYAIIKRETAGTFKIRCKNSKTSARGLCQVTPQAIQDLHFGHEYYIWYYDDMLGVHKKMNYARVYSCKWNIRAGVAYYALCKRRAPRMREALPLFMRTHISEQQVAIMLYCYGLGNLREFVSAWKYAKEF